MKRPYTRNVKLRGSKSRRFENLLFSYPWIHFFTSEVAKFLLAMLIWPRFVALFRWELTRHPLPLANLDPIFHGFKILHLTDLHLGKARPSFLKNAIARCLEEKPDLIVITGDLIDYTPKALPLVQNLLAFLHQHHPPAGTIAIFGNHDYHEYSWRHTGARSARRTIHRRLARIIQDAGVVLLRNQQHRVTHPASPTASFTLVGLDEMWTTLADPAAAFKNVSPADPVICLQHNPDGIDFLLPYPWQFMLCGHSHGGQANFPLLGPMYVPMENRQYLSGLFQFPPLRNQPPALRQRTMFVSRGLGYSTPIRLRCRPEITLFTLEPA